MSKKLSGISILLILFILFVLPQNSFAVSENLVQNPEFEEGSMDDGFSWIYDCWDKAEGVTQFLLDEGQSLKGSSALINNLMIQGLSRQLMSSQILLQNNLLITQNVGSENKGANLSIDNL